MHAELTDEKSKQKLLIDITAFSKESLNPTQTKERSVLPDSPSE